jgi:hypothetical protein
VVDDEGGLDDHIATIPGNAIVGYCVRFLVEVGEEGLVREIVKYIA